jgi:hypothetical protein
MPQQRCASSGWAKVTGVMARHRQNLLQPDAERYRYVISLILYGRNDNYGYNLHKRAALSLNCMAELLSGPDDEILFVDYNTPDDFPTFPEAIQDTLTDRAKQRLRVLRVRPSVHARFRKKSHLLALEPVARNVALRRSNPANRWILSTNTDMIFVTRRSGEDLTGIARELPDGYWGTPRFELPETLWEGFDRRDPVGIISQIGRWGWDYHLNEIVYGADFIRFDAPGDFQLMPRASLIAMHGFHEGMLIGWHVDSNIAKRMLLKHGAIGDLSDRVFGYHCDHTRQVTPMHKGNAVENSLDDFVFNVVQPELPDQATSWGCPDDHIEELRLTHTASVGYVATLDALLAPNPLETPLTTSYTGPTYDQTGYTPEHVLPFLIDLFASVPRDWDIAWIGGHQAMFDLFYAAWGRLGFQGRILVPDELPGSVTLSAAPEAERLPLEQLSERAKVFIFDIICRNGAGPASGSTSADIKWLRVLEDTLLQLMDDESRRRARLSEPRRFVGINAIHNRFERIFTVRMAAARTPFNVRLRHGFVYPTASNIAADCLADLVPGAAGAFLGTQIHSRPLVPGLVAVGPQAVLPPGRYEARLELSVTAESEPPFEVSRELKQRIYRLYRRLPSAMHGIIRSIVALRPGWRDAFAERRPREISAEVVIGTRTLASLRIGEDELVRTFYTIPFEVTEQHFASDGSSLVDLRIISNGMARFAISKLEIAPIGVSGANSLIPKAA